MLDGYTVVPLIIGVYLQLMTNVFLIVVCSMDPGIIPAKVSSYHADVTLDR